ncbi:AzlD domain-containing protein [Erwinia amylovora]
MTMPYDQAWLAVFAMGVVTWLLRSLPFMLNKRARSDDKAEQGSPVFSALGPSLLSAIMIVTLIPGIQQAMAVGYGRALCYGMGILMTLGALRVSRNPGVAVIVGVAIYAAGLWFLAT